MINNTNHRLSIAPMMQYTDRHFRFMMRLITRHTRLYTEMITTGALCHGGRETRLAFDPCESPLALQLGGSCPTELAHCAKLGEAAGYDEINLNVGCPSPRVQRGRLGACLMKAPKQVADCVRAMHSQVALPITVKTRLGVDEQDSWPALLGFIEAVAQAGCQTFIIHARKAWLKGLNPSQNRSIPPLKYDWVHKLKQHYPELSIIINGGLHSLADAQAHFPHVDGAMLGRAAVQNPLLFKDADRLIQPEATPLMPTPTPENVATRMLPYIEAHHANGAPLSCLVKPLMSLWHGQKNAKRWRQALSQGLQSKPQNTDFIKQAIDDISLHPSSDTQE